MKRLMVSLLTKKLNKMKIIFKFHRKDWRIKMILGQHGKIQKSPNAFWKSISSQMPMDSKISNYLRIFQKFTLNQQNQNNGEINLMKAKKTQKKPYLSFYKQKTKKSLGKQLKSIFSLEILSSTTIRKEKKTKLFNIIEKLSRYQRIIFPIS